MTGSGGQRRGCFQITRTGTTKDHSFRPREVAILPNTQSQTQRDEQNEKRGICSKSKNKAKSQKNKLMK